MGEVITTRQLEKFYKKLKEVNKERSSYEDREKKRIEKINEAYLKEYMEKNQFPPLAFYHCTYPEVPFTFDLYLEYTAGGDEVLDVLLPAEKVANE